MLPAKLTHNDQSLPLLMLVSSLPGYLTWNTDMPDPAM